MSDCFGVGRNFFKLSFEFGQGEFKTDDLKKVLNKPVNASQPRHRTANLPFRFTNSLNVRRLIGDRYHFAFALAELFVDQQKNGRQYQANHADHNVSNAQKRILTAQPACVADDQAFAATERRYRVVCGVTRRRKSELRSTKPKIANARYSLYSIFSL